MSSPSPEIHWDSIKLLYCSGTTPATIARGLLGKDAPRPRIHRMVKTICNHVLRDDWKGSIAQAQELVKDSPAMAAKSFSLAARTREELGAAIRDNGRSGYVESVRKAVTRSAQLLEKQEFATLEDSEDAFLKHEPAHRVARDIYGLARDDRGAGQLTVNVLNGFSLEDVTPSVEVETSIDPE